MMRMKKVIMIILLCISVTGTIFAVNAIESKKETPEERKQQREQKEDSGKKTDVQDRKVILSDSRSLELEFLSYEIIEDTEIEKQDTYKAEFFYHGELPDADYQEEVIDYERAEKECPELRDIWGEDSEDKYTGEEVKEIYDKHIGTYTSMQHPKTRYLFVKCQITNLRDKSVEESLSLEHGIVSKDGTEYVYRDGGIYFDKPQHTDGEDRTHSFFFYNFEPGETLECTLGVEIKQQYGEDEEYYIGWKPLDWDENTGWPDKEPKMVKVTEIGGE